MTKQEAVKMFKEHNPELIKDTDRCKKQFAWTCFIDMLCKDGEITQQQYATWGNPSFCK